MIEIVWLYNPFSRCGAGCDAKMHWDIIDYSDHCCGSPWSLQWNVRDFFGIEFRSAIRMYSSIYDTLRKNKGKIWTIALYKFIYQCLLSHNKKKGKENICKVQRRSSTIATKNNSHFACLEHYIHTSDEVLISIREACVYNVYAAAVLPFFHASQVV